VGLEGLDQLKNSIGNRSRDLPACSIVPQSTTLPRAPCSSQNSMFFFRAVSCLEEHKAHLDA
jgi:hypothetical protein